ncbi:hypothetical protein OIDMADRAFT_39415 [Oidiodendron maius Zn]|uniref:Serine/threonine-protein kinase Tel1 n=1 Tax=Oidiodendron maius (strain Zn) TaxID=913774 RepID=A0A0C3DSC6_OIDMZ|nr:hypothetical protein OIDMADRAFT_39415 [Oidiodendron maius Zn]
MVVKAGASKLKPKTVEAVVDHITQTLPKVDGDYCEPLTQDYLKALSAVFKPKANVERLKAATWSQVVDFCIRGISQFSDDGNGEPFGLALRSPGVESSHPSRSVSKSTNGNGRSHGKAGIVSRQNVEELLYTLLSLVSAPNAPILQSSEEITTAVLQFLHSQGSALEDLDMTDFGATAVDACPFRLSVFQLRPHNSRAERNWANLQIIGLLHRLVNIAEQQMRLAAPLLDNDNDKHPRKRQRTGHNSDRLLRPIKTKDDHTRLGALQTLPFILQNYELSTGDLTELLDQLLICASEKRGRTASWALLAIASCTKQKAATRGITFDWVQLWHVGARALTFPATCRAAAAQLHSMLATGLIEYQDVGEDVNAMITAADVSGPVSLCDSALFLMMHLLHVRVTEVPNASLLVCQNVIRWLFARWSPAEKPLAALAAIHVQPCWILDLFRTALGLERLGKTPSTPVPCGPIAQAWQQHLDTEEVVRYILLLDEPDAAGSVLPCAYCPKFSDHNNVSYVLDTAQYLSTSKLILELLIPKLRDLLQSWSNYASDRSSSVSSDTYRRAVNACMTMHLFTPHFVDTTSPQLEIFEADLRSLEAQLIQELRESSLGSDLVLDDVNAVRLVSHAGDILSSSEFSRCEVAQSTCLDIIIGFAELWSKADCNFAEPASDLYQWFISSALEGDIASAEVQKSIARLLLKLLLLRIEPMRGSEITTRSPRSSLINVLQKGNASVKFYIGNQLPDVFKLFILKDHDAVFVDILENLPSDPDWIEGISFRIFVLAKLASTWSTLLRRCIYHIFETPGRIPESVKHATRCLISISSALKVQSPRDLFALFASQLLYTWLESGDIEDIPYQIFGFTSLKDLLKSAQEEAAGLMIMRDQEEAIEYLANALHIPKVELLQSCFSKVTAYSIAYDISTPPVDKSQRHITGEARVKKVLNPDLFFECVHLHFVDIIGIFFNIIDHGDVEKHFMKKEGSAYAGHIMKEIKSLNSSNVSLPPNQQPTFRAKYLTNWIQHLCSRTQYETQSLYTPCLVTSVARKLLNTIHPALGSLHACSVLRKLRVLISLSGDTAISGYPLEMLLQSVSAFITDPECADDAIGIVKYLLVRGSDYLSQWPSFVAGISLSILGSLRIFLQSQEAAQDTQYAETTSRAHNFHSWMRTYVSEYRSPIWHSKSKPIFRALVQSAYNIGLVGNATVGSPESDLLSRLLEDEQAEESLLSRPAREFALTMLCSEFKCPVSFRTDIFGRDELSIANAAAVWKSCRIHGVSKQYLSWAARVLGRAFAASGHIHTELLHESTLSQIKELSIPLRAEDSSRACVLSLLHSLTLGHEQWTVGLAETALRGIVTTSDEMLAGTCQKYLTLSLQAASTWAPYQIPLSETIFNRDFTSSLMDPFTVDAIQQQCWLRDLAIVISQFIPNDPVLRALVPILREVTGFAERAFPFIIHLVLSTASQGQHLAKKKLSAAIVAWFGDCQKVDKNCLKILINSILYLRTQPLPNEKSIAERSYWLDIDYKKAAAAATRCGMFKTALLFTEEFYSEPVVVKSSRRSSGPAQQATVLPTELLLSIFENIDDPDMYYGVPQNASLSAIRARLEYEKDGSKSLAFRGAQYDSHVRRHDPESTRDVQAIVKSLDVLSLSGLSYSLLQAQQIVGMSTASLESMFQTARKLEQWDLPVPSTSNNDAVTIYKAFQAIHNASNSSSILQEINEGLDSTMTRLIREDPSANALHVALQALTALTEMDEVFVTRGSQEFEELTSRFEKRARWMKTGRFDDISHILSCRGTTFSTLSQQTRLHTVIDVSTLDTRLVEVQNALLASELNRSHNALQESLSLATSLMDLIEPCQKLGLNLEVAVHVEAANALWDQGEMASSIGMLQGIEKGSSLKKQTIPVGYSDLLSKIGYQVSIARLEKADRILENYLKPALRELKGKSEGSEASHVFHQFATFCDQQLQDPDSLEDLERLKKLRDRKADEVTFYLGMLGGAKSSAEKAKFKAYHTKAKLWLALDEEELQRHMSSRAEFLHQSLENYLLALSASDDHDNNTLRFTALWLEHSEEIMANEAVSKHLDRVPSRKFAPLMNQLTSRLQDTSVKFQQLLFSLVLRICSDHPFHGMYQIYAGANSRPNSKDEAARSRHSATNKLAKEFSGVQKAHQVWTAISTTNKVYCQLAAEKDERYKANKRFSLKESPALKTLSSILIKYPIPSPTMQIGLAADLDYSKIPVMTRLSSEFSIASGVKGSNDDMRQDAIMEQVFEQVNALLKTNRATRQRNLNIRTYKVLPLTSIAGIIEFVANTIPLHEYLMPAHERFYPRDLKGNQCRKEIGEVQTQSQQVRIQKFRDVTARFHPVMRYFFTENFDDPDEWFVKRLAYTRSTAAVSILGHVLGLGDRHGHNILLDSVSGEVVHIDLGVAFEMGRVLPVPELVPFRLTRDIVDGMGITKTEGVFRRCCEFTLEALRKEVYSITTILDVLRYDPLYSWSISPVRLAKLQQEQDQSAALDGETGTVPERTKEAVNEPGEADRALTVVGKKLSKTLSVTATVNDLINQASDERNLALLYSGWAAYA